MAVFRQFIMYYSFKIVEVKQALKPILLSIQLCLYVAIICAMPACKPKERKTAPIPPLPQANENTYQVHL